MKERCRAYKTGKKIVVPPLRNANVNVVLEGYRRCPDSHDVSECHHLYDLGRQT